MRQCALLGMILLLTLGLSATTRAQWESSSGTFQTVDALIIHNGTLYSSEGASVYRTSDNGNSWSEIRTGLPIGTPGRVYSFASNGVDLFAGTYQRGVYQWTNDSAWVKHANNNPPSSIFGLVAKGSNLFAATNFVGIYRSTDNGFTWAAANTGLTSGFVLSIVVSGPYLVASSSDSGVFRSSDDGGSWTSANNGLPSGEFIRGFGVQGPTLFAGGGLGVYTSTDNGASWTSFSSGLTGYPVVTFGTHGADLFAGTIGSGGGVFRLEGGTWTPINEGLTLDHVFAFAADETSLYVGIDLGTWRRPLSQITSVRHIDGSAMPYRLTLSQNYPNPFNPMTTIGFEIPVGTGHAVSLRVYDLLGRDVATLVNEVMEPGTYSVEWDGSRQASGVYVYRLTAGDFSATRRLVLVK